ncbi:MAG TPA: rhodanese-like domain-containing protein, partial [Thermomonas sp.]|nr:rhodanese-like domain-containing protein [Thermomonas sp.]
GLPTTSMQRAPMTVRPYPAVFDTTYLLDADAVQAHLDDGGMLLDARAAVRFRGEEEPIDRVAGHVPGAINRPYAQNLGPDGRFKSPMQLAAEFRELLAGRDPVEVVSMCGSGVTACHTLLAMERAGLRGARLYTGSWSGWITDPTRPVATGA